LTEVTHYRWRSDYGGLKSVRVRQLKSLDMKNFLPRRAISDLLLEKSILMEAASGNF
jgi:putative transposase